jgi:uncharacterized protein YgbK (DUF1537 family)
VPEASELMEKTLATIATGLVSLGIRQLVVAGGETSGACVQALGVTQMQIGFQIDPCAPWCHAQSAVRTADTTQVALHMASMSGNFGADDFFTKAFELLGKDAV